MILPMYTVDPFVLHHTPPQKCDGAKIMMLNTKKADNGDKN